MPEDDEHRSRTAYDRVADLYADHFSATEPEQPIELAMIDHFVASLPERPTVLDAGCGAGRMLPYLAARGCAVEGVDLSAEMVRRARQDHPEFPVRVGSLTDLPAEDGAYDGVFAWYSTIHNPDEDLPLMLAEMRRVLRPGGHVLVAFQTGSGPREVGGGYRRRGQDVELVRHHRPVAQVRAAMERSGLAVTCVTERAAVPPEEDGQAVVVAAAPGTPA